MTHLVPSLRMPTFQPSPRAMRYLLLAAWGLACAAPLRWMVFALAQPSHVVQRGVLLCLAVLALMDWVRQPQAAQVHPRAVPIVLLGITVATVARVGTDIQFIHAGAALLLLHALSATFLDARAWRQRFVLVAAVLLCLPIQPHVDAHLGLPLRLWTASVVAPLLEALGVESVSVGSIIVTENSVSDVASVCSGVRTLWYAVALWLGARLVWPQASARRWALAGLLSVAAAVGLNALRVAALVLALHHKAPPLLADMAHAALGLLALALAGSINWLLCRAPSTCTNTSSAAVPFAAHADIPVVATIAAPPPQHPHSRQLAQPTYLLLAGLMCAVALLPSPARKPTPPAPLQALTWPAALHTEPVPMSATERDLVLGRGATVAEKHRFNFHGMRGSLLVVQSLDWRAHHAPELCLLAQGAHLEQQTQINTPNGAFRLLTMQAGSQTALTWFQSDARVLPDLGARWWSQLRNPHEKWSLITIVVDGAVSASAAHDLHHAVHAVVKNSP